MIAQQPAPTHEAAGIVAEARGVTREFRTPGGDVHALRGVDLVVRAAEMVALSGRSGSGKTTLLNILTGLDQPTSGEVLLIGRPLAQMSETARADLRRTSVGILFQNAHLFPLLSAKENVEVMMRLARKPAAIRTRHALLALELVGLSSRAHHRGLELSGGEQQRVALARALVHEPHFVIADEPTGNLDVRTGREIIALLRDLVHDLRIGLLIATHDANVVAAADRAVHLHDGIVTQHG